jgi:hypothetical protein
MYSPWNLVALIVTLLFSDAFAIALGGQKFTVIPDKRQAQDLVRTQRVDSHSCFSSDDFKGDLG